MLALKALVIGMGVLIVAGVAVIGATLAARMSPSTAPMASVRLDEPAGTRIAATTLAPDRMAVQLQGGGPDRIVLLDTRTGHIIGRIGLAP